MRDLNKATKNLSHGFRATNRTQEPLPPKYKARAVTIELQRWMNGKKVFYNDRKGLYSAARSWMQESTSRTSCALLFTVDSVRKRRNG
jgi:hypothetical protein